MKTGKEQAEELRLLRADKEKARAICRQIRDNEDATDSDRLEAIRILNDMEN